MAHLGIVTATFQRCRFLPGVLAQMRAQTYSRWRFVLVSDGPDSRARDIFHRHRHDDLRMNYLETAKRARDWGGTPRQAGLAFFASLPQPPEYIVFWDDDDSRVPDALQTVAQELEHYEHPDLLVMPLAAALSQIPRWDLKLDQLRGCDVCTGNFVMRFSVAQNFWGQSQCRGEDCRFFNRVRAKGSLRIALSRVSPIGRYDGLRFFTTLRWKLGIPPLGFYRLHWYDVIRRRWRR